MIYTLSKYQKIEGFLHLLFWGFIFSAVNVSWHHDWFDATIRTNTPSPLSVIVFPFLFYAHAFWAIPKFFVTRKWVRYILSAGLIFIGTELIRLAFYVVVLERPLVPEIWGRDSFLLGSLNIAWLAFVFSLVYRLIIDRVFGPIPNPTLSPTKAKTTNSPLYLQPADAQKLQYDLARLMEENQLFLREDLSLSKLASYLDITDKKLSALLNQNLSTNFTDYINAYRVRYFIEEVERHKLQQLSINGLANQCGFSSKSTFYRAFKKVKGCTPTEFLSSPE